MALLGVNIDHVATVRQAPGRTSLIRCGRPSRRSWAAPDGITFHLREDRRHINDRDARLLKETVAVKLNMEMSIAAEIVGIAVELKPDQCTLVPESREELTTEGGLDVVRHRDRVREAVQRLRGQGIVVARFIEPLGEQIEAAAEVGFHAVGAVDRKLRSHARTAPQQGSALESRGKGSSGSKSGAGGPRGHGLDLPQRRGRRGAAFCGVQHRTLHRLAGGVRGDAGSRPEMKRLLAVHAPSGGAV